MTDSKKYWYIQLNVNFFEDERIDWLCEQQNGYAYVVLYLKLCLKTANNNGILTRQIGDMIIPYNVDKIAEITHINVDIVRVALELYKKIGLVYEADENCNFMRLPEVPQMVGCITQAAIDKRKQRERKKLLPEPDNIPDNVQDNVPQELRVKSIELRDNSSEQEKEANAREAVLSAVLSHYQDCITPTPPSTVSQLLIAYTDELGPDVVIHAIDEAVNQRKLTWGYIQAILQRYSREGLNTLAKVEADETERRNRKDAGTDKPAKRRDWGVLYTVDGRKAGSTQ